MASNKVIPTETELAAFNLDDPQTIELIQHARDSYEADAKLTLREAVKKYKKACFWAFFLSTSLIMEGYDLVIVCPSPVYTSSTFILTNVDYPRSPRSMARHSSASDSAPSILPRVTSSSRRLGSPASATRPWSASWPVC